MIKEKLVVSTLIVVLYVLSGAGVWSLYQVQHVVEADWAKLSSYLVVIPLIKMVSLLPGVVVGYLFGARQWFFVK